MQLRCATCSVDCTVDDDSVQTVSCPSCGKLLYSASTVAGDSLIVVERPIGVDSLTAIGQFIPTDTTRNWGQSQAGELLSASRLPCQLGRYNVLKLLASGGFAQVFLASDTEIQREVALKLPRGDRVASQERMSAMIAEARLAARVRHANIATVYDVGYLTTGVPFISMEFVTGGTFQKLLELENPPVRQSLEMLASVADALQHAHQDGLVHRDLKPGNILIDEFRQPKIVDFGLALDENQNAGQGGDISGTPAYMAPEQIRGEAHRLDGRTDIWALGVILYEVLCGRRPFNGSRERVFDEVLHRDPKPPRQHDDTVPKELESICLKCLAKSPAARYSTCGDIASAIRDWLSQSWTEAPPETTSRSGSGTRKFNTLLAADQSSTSRRITPLVSAPVRPRRRSRKLWLGLTLASFLLVAGTLWAPVLGLLSSTTPANQTRVLGRWYETLDHKPAPVMWTAIAKDSNWQWNPESHQTTVTSNYPAAFQTGTTDSNSFRLEVRFSTGSATGDSGLFWGAHEAPAEHGVTGTDFQVVTFNRLQNETPANSFRLSRTQNTTWTPRGGPSPLMNREMLTGARVGAPTEPQQVLQILVLQGQLREVRWNGQIYDKMGEPDLLGPALRPLVCPGGFGIYNEGGTTIFHEVRIEEINAPDPGTP
ncbi:MAG: serine/threonine-protein kinase [Planctomycetota bacterium]|nr:serine/threonine-protein kinase [Planctomycetota bacterium]